MLHIVMIFGAMLWAGVGLAMPNCQESFDYWDNYVRTEQQEHRRRHNSVTPEAWVRYKKEVSKSIRDRIAQNNIDIKNMYIDNLKNLPRFLTFCEYLATQYNIRRAAFDRNAIYVTLVDAPHRGVGEVIGGGLLFKITQLFTYQV